MASAFSPGAISSLIVILEKPDESRPGDPLWLAAMVALAKIRIASIVDERAL
jgi:hypothetical protein